MRPLLRTAGRVDLSDKLTRKKSALAAKTADELYVSASSLLRPDGVLTCDPREALGTLSTSVGTATHTNDDIARIRHHWYRRRARMEVSLPHSMDQASEYDWWFLVAVAIAVPELIKTPKMWMLHVSMNDKRNQTINSPFLDMATVVDLSQFMAVVSALADTLVARAEVLATPSQPGLLAKFSFAPTLF